jgi:hypothetical protein
MVVVIIVFGARRNILIRHSHVSAINIGIITKNTESWSKETRMLSLALNDDVAKER